MRAEASRLENDRIAREHSKELWRKKNREWYHKNKDRIDYKGYCTKWREKNPEKVKEYAAAWREKNRELANERSRESMRKLRAKRKKEKEEEYIKNILQKYNSN